MPVRRGDEIKVRNVNDYKENQRDKLMFLSQQWRGKAHVMQEFKDQFDEQVTEQIFGD